MSDPNGSFDGHMHYMRLAAEQAQEIERLNATVEGLDRQNDYLAAELSQLKSRQSGVVLPERYDPEGYSAGSPEWHSAHARNDCLDEVARLNPAEQLNKAQAVSGKYAEVLKPFLAMMENELHANAGKGDRPGWLKMDRKTALLEIYYHLGKLQKAAKDDDQTGIIEYAADVANMSMMLVDVCGLLSAIPSPANQQE
ncbi:hypothetical protein ACVTMO_16895 [Pseudomonas segetis]